MHDENDSFLEDADKKVKGKKKKIGKKFTEGDIIAFFKVGSMLGHS